MKTLVFLYDYAYLNNAIDKLCKNYYKILIVQRNKFEDTEFKRKVFDEIIIVEDIFSLEKMEMVFREILNRCSVYRIITAYEKTVEVAGFLRDRFSIAGLNYNTSELVRNKYKMKKLLREHNIKTSAFNFFSDKKSAEEFIRTASA